MDYFGVAKNFDAASYNVQQGTELEGVLDRWYISYPNPMPGFLLQRGARGDIHRGVGPLFRVCRMDILKPEDEQQLMELADAIVKSSGWLLV
jgi:hypothetical protein